MSNNRKYGIIIAGFSGIAGQILLLRGLETTFGGNELSLAVFFASWFIWSGTGVMSGKYFTTSTFFILLAVQGFILFPELILIKSYPVIIHIESGVLPSINQMLVGGFLLTAPYAFITGALFTTGIKVSGLKPGNIYALEALGAGLAGIFAAIFMGNISSLQIAGILFTLNIAIAIGKMLFSFLPIAVGLFIIFYLSPIIDASILSNKYPDFNIISHLESKYGDIVITKRNELNAVYINGQLNSSYPNPYFAEESVHFPLLAHSNPQEVLLIGGGFSGAMQEILKHPSVKRLYYAEIDDKLIEVILENFPHEVVAEYYLPEVELINADGRAWLKKNEEKFDVIITALPPPSTAQLNRYYTEEFFNEAKNSMNPGGVFGFIVESSEDFIDKSLAEFLAGFQNTMGKAFTHTTILPGYNACFLGSQSEIIVSLDSLMTRMANRKLDNEFISPSYLPHRLSEESSNYLHQSISEIRAPRINRDFSPIAYINYLKRWESQFHPNGFNILQVSSKNGIIFSLGIIIIIIFILMARRNRSGFDKSVSTAVFTTGIAQIGMQLIILLGFQSLYGYLYYQQAVLIAAFMIGAACGGWFSARTYNRTRVELKKMLFGIQLVLIFFPILIMLILMSLQVLPSWMKHTLTITALLSGCVGGAQYSFAANYIKGKPASVGGNLYTLDLVGAAVGALIIGLIFMPEAGFLTSALILSGLSLLPAGLMTAFRKDS